MKLSKQQSNQEQKYVFPYHYRDLSIEMFKKIYSLEYLEFIRVVKELLKPYKGQSVLDAGCGDGRFCYELKRENVRVAGVDYSEKAIAFARAFNPELEFYVSDLLSLDLPAKFDTVVLLETLDRYLDFLARYFRDNVSSGGPGQCIDLIAVCEKR